eukprot:TRINITY_DN2747_c0_g1_i6.p1 TRINITY_DN2747_c0_g1~~TRINITY_DN2747_c0_g1_i6.p1  ORF type:complete len:306 (-),score=38.96 TRINITY_DN2747_c0_g1_i6:2-919(-)
MQSLFSYNHLRVLNVIFYIPSLVTFILVTTGAILPPIFEYMGTVPTVLTPAISCMKIAWSVIYIMDGLYVVSCFLPEPYRVRQFVVCDKISFWFVLVHFLDTAWMWFLAAGIYWGAFGLSFLAAILSWVTYIRSAISMWYANRILSHSIQRGTVPSTCEVFERTVREYWYVEVPRSIRAAWVAFFGLDMLMIFMIVTCGWDGQPLNGEGYQAWAVIFQGLLAILILGVGIIRRDPVLLGTGAWTFGAVWWYSAQNGLSTGGDSAFVISFLCWVVAVVFITKRTREYVKARKTVYSGYAMVDTEPI